MAKTKSFGLGKGLAALLEETPVQESGFLPALAIEALLPNPNQPRAHIDPEELVGLADSIREHGIIEPLIVTAIPAELNGPDKPAQAQYMLVAGERRWRAAKLAQLQTVPVIVKDLGRQEVLELAIIENIQRRDLNALEEAIAINELHRTFGIKLEVLQRKLGRDLSTLSNKMRLLKLPKIIQQGLLDGQITESHAYQLLTLKSTDAMLAAYNIVSKTKLSVQQTEDLVRKIQHANREVIPPSQKQNAVIFDEKTIKITDDLSGKLGKGVKLVRHRQGGKLTIPFANDEVLAKIYQYLLTL